MSNPHLDSGGYPTEETLERIKSWDVKDFVGLADFLCEAWWYPNRAFLSTSKDGRPMLHLSTGGWSGNEDMLGHLPKLWDLFYFHTHTRGGHYVYEGLSPEQAPDAVLRAKIEELEGELASHKAAIRLLQEQAAAVLADMPTGISGPALVGLEILIPKDVLEAAQNLVHKECPDGGRCHHTCKEGECFRVRACGPLLGVYPDDRWPDEVVADFGRVPAKAKGCD